MALCQALVEQQTGVVITERSGLFNDVVAIDQVAASEREDGSLDLTLVLKRKRTPAANGAVVHPFVFTQTALQSDTGAVVAKGMLEGGEASFTEILKMHEGTLKLRIPCPASGGSASILGEVVSPEGGERFVFQITDRALIENGSLLFERVGAVCGA